MRKKIIMLIVSIMFSVIYTSPVMAENDYNWTEAEIGTLEGFTETENENASGGKLISIYERNDPSGEYSVEVPLMVENAGSYDIWVLATSPSAKNVSPYKWSINAGTALEYESTGEEMCAVYEQRIGSVNYELMWSRPAKNVQLAENENIFKFSVDTKASTGARRYLAMIDCVVAVPASWDWQPEGNLDRPLPIPAEYAWIELENPTNETVLGIGNTEEASGGKILSAYAKSANNDKGTAVVNYSFKVDNSEEYDIWYLGTTTGVDYLSTMKWDVDSEDPETTAVKHNVPQTSEDSTILESTDANGEFPLYWQKMGKKQLESGNHTLNLVYYHRAMSAGLFLWADCVVVVPSSWNWKPGMLSEGLHPAYDMTYLDAEYVYRTYFTEDYSSVTENIVVPDGNIKTIGKSIISFTSDNEQILSKEGTVNRPFFDEESKTVNLNICASSSGKTLLYPIPVTVVKQEKYEISHLKLMGEDELPATELVPGETLTASAELSLNVSDNSETQGSAVLIIALYNNEILEEIFVSDSEITKAGETLTTSLTLPENVAEHSVKVFLLNSLKMGNLMAEEISIGR